MKTIIALLVLACTPVCQAAELLELCISMSVAQAGAEPTTLALRTALTSTDATEDQRRIASMKLNAIYNAAVAQGRLEYLRVRSIQNESARISAQEEMQRQFLLMQNWNWNWPPIYPR